MATCVKAHSIGAEEKGEAALPDLAILPLARLQGNERKWFRVTSLMLRTPQPVEKRTTSVLHSLLTAIEHMIDSHRQKSNFNFILSWAYEVRIGRVRTLPQNMICLRGNPRHLRKPLQDIEAETLICCLLSRSLYLRTCPS